MDRFYTPAHIANRMVQCATISEPQLIADFTSGYGELLKAAEASWPSAKLIATDISSSSIADLRRKNLRWQLGRCDFLNARSRAHCKVLAKLVGKVSIILINPPFSCRGGRYYSTEFHGSSLTCSLAVLFVLKSLPFLAPEGEMIALLPSGCLNNQKDEHAWNALRKNYRIKIFETNGRGTFDGCTAETVIVRLVPRKRVLTSNDSTPTESNGKAGGLKTINLFRGKIPMYLANGSKSANAITLIHTTELKADKIDLLARKVEPKWKGIRGPAVLLPRVGKPSSAKIKLYLRREIAALSDCVIGLRCRTTGDAKDLQTLLVGNWESLNERYGGTCAKHIKVKSLCEFLESQGFRVKIDRGLVGNGTKE